MCRTGKSLRIFSSPAAFRHSDPWIMANMRDGTPLEISMKFSAPPERLGAAHAPRGRRSRVPWARCQFVTKVEKKTQRTPAKIVFVARPGSGCDPPIGNQALWASLGEGWTCVKADWGRLRSFLNRNEKSPPNSPTLNVVAQSRASPAFLIRPPLLSRLHPAHRLALFSRSSAQAVDGRMSHGGARLADSRVRGTFRPA